MIELVLDGGEVGEIDGDARMAVTMDHAIQAEDQSVERIGYLVFPSVIVRVRETGHGLGEIRGVGARRRLELDRSLEQAERAIGLTPIAQHIAERGHGSGDLPRVRRRQSRIHRQRQVGERIGLIVPRLIDAKQAEALVAVGHVHVVATVERPTLLETGAQKRVGSIELAKLLVDVAERRVERRLDRWLSIERACFAHAAIDDGQHAQTIRGPFIRVAALEQAQHEPLHAIRARRLVHGRGPRTGETDRVIRRQAYDDRDDRREPGERAPVSLHELHGPIAHRIGSRLERLIPQVVVDVPNQRLGRLIAPRRIPVHGGQTQHIEIRP